MLLDRTEEGLGLADSLTADEYRTRNERISALFHGPPAPESSMRDFMAITKALADENRVRMLLALRDGELCACQIIELVQLAPSTVSKHMSILKQARLVDSRKDGRWVYYRLGDTAAPGIVRHTIAWVERALADDEQVIADRRRLKRILVCDPHELCEKQCSPKHAGGRPTVVRGARR
jgi:ArsR family transcriptional regulator, arsenate/arsenite/antimonite-responsive transcriptional repressor